MLTGHTPSDGTGAQMSFSLTNDATLTWRWVYAFELSASAGPNGTVTPTGGWYVNGSTVVVTSTPSAFYHLDAWSGNLTYATQDYNLLTLLMLEPCAVSASFAPNLTAARGVPEYWLASYGWTQDFEAAAEADTDSDGHPAWMEWLADTDPTNTQSVLKMTSLIWTNGITEVSWRGGVARTQVVEHAVFPSGPWQPLQTNLPPTPVSNRRLHAPLSPAGFYRISVP